MGTPTPMPPHEATHLAHRLTDALGLPVVTPDGQPLGRLADVLVALGPDYPPVAALTVRGRRHERSTVPWTAGSHIAADRVIVEPGPADAQRRGIPGAGPHLSLVRDVLDVQVIDVGRRRVGRVADVDLANVQGALRLVGVDIGLTGVLRRLGLGRFAARAQRDMIDWRALHLAGGPARAVQLQSPAAAVHRLDPEDLAQVLMRVPARAGAEILATSDDVRAAAALASTHPDLGADLLETLPLHRASALLAAMDAATAGVVMHQIAPTRRDALMAALDPSRAAALADALGAAEPPPPEPHRRWWRVLRGHGRPAP